MKRLGFLVALSALLFSVPAFAASLVAHIDISTQTMQVSVNGAPRYVWPVSTARLGYHTPTGSYRPIRLERIWHSTIYDNAPMPYAVFFRGGYAIHGTNAVGHLGRPASHGCVRLDTGNAATLFSLVSQYGYGNTAIVISY
jgi:lipoprotein-anchoring transpeptidase ErfK/SrfK